VPLRPEDLTGALAPFRDEQFFEQVFIDSGAVAWPGEIDLAPDACMLRSPASATDCNTLAEKKAEPYQLFEGAEYTYRVFVTDIDAPIHMVVRLYRGRAGAENLIKEANNDAGLAAHPSTRRAANCVHFQLALLAYNLNCWLMLFHRDEGLQTADLRHTTIATARLRFLFLAAKMVRHAGSVLTTQFSRGPTKPFPYSTGVVLNRARYSAANRRVSSPL